jgi:SAM-dependent methyltransferase
MPTTNITSFGIEKVYARWAPIYDLVFGAIFERGRRAVVEASERLGGRVLEVGVGTGISLPYYSDRCRVVGIDLSEQMLRKARQRVLEGRLQNVEQLAVMNAERLDFASASFDVVVAQLCHQHGAESRNGSRRVCPCAETRRRNCPLQPGRSRSGCAACVRAPFRADRQEVGVALRLPLGAI